MVAMRQTMRTSNTHGLGIPLFALELYWQKFREHPRKLAKHLGVNPNLMERIPPDPEDFQDLVSKIRDKTYEDLSAGSANEEDVAICVARVQTFGMVDGLRVKYSKIAKPEALKALIIDSVDSWTEISPSRGVEAWNERTRKRVVGQDDRFAAHVTVTLYVTYDFPTAVSVIKQINACGGGSSCALIIDAPKGSPSLYHAVSAQHASADGRSIQAMDQAHDGVPHVVTPNNFLELVLYDTFATTDGATEFTITNPDYVSTVQCIAREKEMRCVASTRWTGSRLGECDHPLSDEFAEGVDSQDTADDVSGVPCDPIDCWMERGRFDEGDEDVADDDEVEGQRSGPICWIWCPRGSCR